MPLIPGFVWIYILAFPFWAVNYILAAQRGKDGFYRFVATDLTVHLACFVIFLFTADYKCTGRKLSGSYMVRTDAEVGLCTWMVETALRILFPSIHCYVSWLSWRGVNNSDRIPKWYQHFSLIFAILIIISTQVLKQHYLVDAIAGVALVEFAWRFSQYQETVISVVPKFFVEKIT